MLKACVQSRGRDIFKHMSHVGLEKDSDTDARFYQILVDTIGDLPYRNWVLQTMAIQSMTHHRIQGMFCVRFRTISASIV